MKEKEFKYIYNPFWRSSFFSHSAANTYGGSCSRPYYFRDWRGKYL